MFLQSLEGPASDIKRVFSAHVVNLEGFYTGTPFHFHAKKTKRVSEKQLKLGNSHLQSQPAGFRHRAFMIPMHNGHLLGCQNMYCMPLTIQKSKECLFNTI